MDAKVNRRDAHSDSTRRALLREARRQFAAHGFAGAGIELIARRARVTTGALYHHFGNKKDLFEAVAEQVEQELMKRALEAAATESDPWQMLVVGVDVILDACAEPDIHRIAFREAPNVLGQTRWREIEERYAFGQLCGLLEALINAGTIAPGPVKLYARVLLAGISEIAESIAGAEDPEMARLEGRAVVARLLGALRL